MSSAERENSCSEAWIRALLVRQLGLITADQAAAHGLGRSSVSRRVAAGRWQRLLPGVSRDGLVPAVAGQMALAAVLWAGADAVAAFTTVGSLMGLDGVGHGRAHVWVPPTRAPRHDLAGVLGDEDLEVAVEDAIHRGLTTPQSVARRLDALGGRGRPGSARLREILRDRGDQAAAASRLEVRIWRTLRASGLRPVRQHRVKVGDRTYSVDCAFPQWRLAVEGVGDRYHRSPRHRESDLRRLADLASISWRVPSRDVARHHGCTRHRGRPGDARARRRMRTRRRAQPGPFVEA